MATRPNLREDMSTKCLSRMYWSIIDKRIHYFKEHRL